MDNEQYAYLSAQWQQELDEAGQRILVQAARLDEIHAMMLDTFYELGGRMIDTAEGYSAWVPGHKGGESETVLGQWLESRAVRADMRIGTKTNMLGKPGMLSPDKVAAALEGSLERLRTDYVDLYYAHRDETGTPLDITLFNVKYTVEQLVPDRYYIFYGRVTGTLLRREMSAPEIYPADGGQQGEQPGGGANRTGRPALAQGTLWLAGGLGRREREEPHGSRALCVGGRPLRSHPARLSGRARSDGRTPPLRAGAGAEPVRGPAFAGGESAAPNRARLLRPDTSAS